MRSGRVAVLAALLLAAAAPAAADEAEWIESYDKASNKKFYYNSVSRESAWEAPAGAKIKYMTADESFSQSSSPTKSDGGMMILGIILVPMLLLFGGLFIVAQRATGEGLLEALAEKKKERNRAAKRRGSQAGSNFRHRQKLSQDGKGGRSANS